MKEILANFVRAIERIGTATLAGIQQTGEMSIFLSKAMISGLRPPYRLRLVFQQMEFVGFGSLFIIVLTGSFTGMVFTLQTVNALERVGMESMVGSSTMLAVSRELAPVLTSLMVTGRVGSSMATELGTMRVTEQIDAMSVMAVDPIKYLIFPRLIAGAVMVPALAILFDVVAFIGSYFIAVPVLGLDEGSYLSRLEWYLDPYDFYQGILKAFVFGLVLTTVGTFKGFYAAGGARGVGIATTQAVVIGSIATFMLDYVLTALMLALFPEY